MNYQKLLSRFYNTNEQSNAEMQKCQNFVNVQTEEVITTISKNDNNDEEFDEELKVEEVSIFAEIEDNGPTAQHWDTSQENLSCTETISPEKVRWFYKATDEKVWSEFDGYDSLLIENKYRDLKAESQPDLEAEDDIIHLDKVGVGSDGAFVNVHSELNLQKDLKDDLAESPVKKAKKEEVKLRNDDLNNEDVEDDDAKANKMKYIISVRGGMYEVDLTAMTCESIYWPGEQYVITRGLYFYDGSWQPLEGCYGEVLEEEHLRLFSKKNIDSNEKSQIQAGSAIHSHHFTDFHVEWISAAEIFLYWGGAPRQLVRSVTQKLGFYQSTGYKLKRGYRKKATASERPPEISHVVFVIHGIGQKMDSGRIIRNTNALRTNCDWLRSQYPICGTGENKGRAELFPARWRAGERGDAAELLAAAAPMGAPALRRAINDAAMDVMYYTSPVYGKQVQDDLTSELNRLYTKFMTRNPNYKGHFSAVAHSLGCVIIYDVITGYQMGCEQCTNVEEPTQSSGCKLLFQLQNLFCLGSPLGVFLSLRQPRPGQPRILPAGFNTRLYNIFHLSDPVAYRLEPLFASWLAKHSPLVIPAHYSAPLTSPGSQASPAKGPWRIWSYVKHPWQRSETNSPITASNSQNPDISESPLKIKTTDLNRKPSITPNMDNVNKPFIESSDLDGYDNDGDPNFDICDQVLDDGYSKVKVEVTSEDNEQNPEDVLPYRIDYTLRDSFITNNYIWAITSHTTYWNNYDVAYFILSRLFVEVNSDGECDHASDNST